MIALLIDSITLSISAPIITKQIQHSTHSDTQSMVINSKINKIENNQVPSGMIAFFDKPCDEIKCCFKRIHK